MNERLEAIAAIASLPPQARVLLLGAVDTGKSTFAAEAVSALILRDRLPVAVVDGDVGQSEIGAPGVVGVGLVERSQPRPTPIRALSQVALAAGVFVGATNPLSHTLAWCSATVQAAQMTGLANPKPVVTLIDTPGIVTGAGVPMFHALIALLRPQLVLAFARGGELEAILRPIAMTAASGTQVLGVPVGPEVGRKTGAMRATRRAARYLQHLQGASRLLLHWDQIALVNTSLSYGQPLMPHEMRYIGTALGGSCVYAERQADPAQALVVMADAPPLLRPDNTSVLEQPLKTSRVVVTLASRFEGLLCGLHGRQGELLDIGTIQSADYERRRFDVQTRVKHPGAVAKLALGYVRVKADGREIGQLQPGQAV